MDSAKILKFENIPNEKFIRYAIKNTLSANGMNDGVHIRLTLTRGPKISSSMNPKFNLFGCVLIALPEWKLICGPTTYDNSKGISLVTSSIRRNSPQCLDSKIHHCNLINNILAKIDANNGSAADAVMLDCDGFVAETNATNLFCVKNQILYTPSADYCLPGCTRDVVINIAKSNNIVCVEKRLSISEFYTADEVFTTGTMGEITPVKSIDKRDISGPFDLTKQLQSLLLIQTANFSENII
jgi:branched-subunit amino acid aminotransferase/4-amino-4-deoxychorismate lyase